MRKPPVIFVHIPKTAGTTLGGMLQKHCIETWGESAYFVIRGHPSETERLKQMHAQDRNRIRVLSGHFFYGIHETLPQRTHRYITMLREPVSRIISLYFYAAHTPSNYMHEAIKNGLTFEDVMSGNHYVEFFNLQTRLIAGKGPWKSDDDCLDAAKQNLEHSFSAFGMTERFDESFALLRAAVPWALPPAPPSEKLNQTPHDSRREAISDSLKELIRERNQLDLRFYEFAMTLFEKRVEEAKRRGSQPVFVERIRSMAHSMTSPFRRLAGAK